MHGLNPGRRLELETACLNQRPFLRKLDVMKLDYACRTVFTDVDNEGVAFSENSDASRIHAI